MHVSGAFDGLEDDELMRRTAAGERDAFRTLVRRHQSRALSFGARYLGSPAIARDVAQDAFVDLFLAASTYRAQARFGAFWHRILLNRCQMAARSARTRAVAHTRLEAVPEVSASAAEDALIARQREVAVQRGVDALSEKLRAVVVLRFQSGLALQDIASALELPLGTVKSRLFAGLAELRRNLEDEA